MTDDTNPNEGAKYTSPDDVERTRVETHRRWTENIQYEVTLAREADGRIVSILRYESPEQIVDPARLPDDWDGQDVRQAYWSS